MKTAEEVLIQTLNEWSNPDDLDLMTILAKRSLPFMEKAMEAYAQQFNPKDDEAEAVERLAKEKNIVCWLIPVSYDDGKVTWGYEIELLPYSPIAKIGSLLPEKSNIIHSYQQWDTYDKAREQMLLKANELQSLFLSSKQGMDKQTNK
jgi:hypothetical protein